MGEPTLSVIVVAGGIGQRFGADLPKQFLPLAGKPMVQWSLECFDALPFVSRLILVLPEAWLLEGPAWLAGFHAGVPFAIVAGGRERQDSVLAGLAAIPEEDGWVAVHDGARPGIRPEVVRAAWDVALRHGSAVCAIPGVDTLVRCADMCLAEDVSRVGVFRVQTPQIFPVADLREAIGRARNEGHLGTDDAGLVRRLGRPVRLAAGAADNFKITLPEDLAMMEQILSGRKRI